MSFKKQKYLVIKNAVPKIIADYSFHYLLLKRSVFYKMDTLKHFGNYGDPMIPNSYCHYSDILMETLLVEMLSLMKKKTKLDLIPTYTYCRIYKKGDELKRHKDRPSCAISTTVNLGGDPWPIYLEPSGKTNMKGIKINLKPGDMLIYDGCELEHWREPFKGKVCAQVFLHYNINCNKSNKFDGRPMLGLPLEYQNAKKK
jgi:hypothetical protein|tara:strand:- start:2004 stop:2603 length:600 start_codon:yes stop_codon:yes gene_type:complete